VSEQRVVVKLSSGGRLRAAVDETLTALDDLGRVDQIDAASVESVRVLADALDEDAANAALWAQFRAALTELRGLNDGGDDELAQLTAAMRAAVGDAKDS